jgi:hypothetical protein
MPNHLVRRLAVHPGVALAGIAIAAGIAYAPSLAVPFQFDDEARLSHNIAMQQGALLDALSWLGNSRVVPSLTLLLNYRIGGFEPVGYHIVNFAVHLLATFGVFALALALCRAPRLSDAFPPNRALLLATAAGFFFACDPLQTEAVTYIVQRYSSMAALFYVWAIVCYLRARLRGTGVEYGSPRPYFVMAALLGIAAILSKENAITLPFAILLTEWIGFGWPQRWLPIAATGAGLFLGALALVIAWKTVIWHRAITSAQPYDAPLLQQVLDAIFDPRQAPLRGTRSTAFEYLLTEMTVLPRYLLLAVVPWGLNVDPDVPIARGFSLPVVSGIALLLGFAVFALSQVRHRPLVAFGIFWFLLTSSVESSVFAISDVMAEHRMYLPMAGLALIVGWVFVAAFVRARPIAMVVAAGLLSASIALTFARNVVWQSPLTLWLDTVQKSPDKARPHVNLGAAYHNAGWLNEAVEQYCRALKIDPDDPLAHDDLELALTTLGKFDSIAPKVVERRPDGSVVLEIEDAVAFCPRDAPS